jgi:formate hydrogenlyase subunit 4
MLYAFFSRHCFSFVSLNSSQSVIIIIIIIVIVVVVVAAAAVVRTFTPNFRILSMTKY